jgi:putative ABC transport system permease protein
MVSMIFRSTLRWTLLAALLAIPPALFYLRSWLQGFPVRIPLYWWIFGSAIVVIVLFQSLVTLGKTRRAAGQNPVEALRYE